MCASVKIIIAAMIFKPTFNLSLILKVYSFFLFKGDYDYQEFLATYNDTADSKDKDVAEIESRFLY